MQRRQFIAGLGAAASGSALVGTGAFSSVTASRTVSVTVANESQAYLGIQASNGSNGYFSSNQSAANGELALDFNDEISDISGSGVGVGQDSQYEFDDVFRVVNQGTQDTYVQVDDVSYDSGDVTLQFYVRDGSGNRVHIDGSDGEAKISTGNLGKIGVYIATAETSTGDKNGATTVTGQDSSFGTTTTVDSGSNDIVTS
jgi:hypothetical protein